MGARTLNRMFAAVALFVAVSFVGASVPANAQGRPKQDQKRNEQKKTPEQKKQKEARKPEQPRPQQAQGKPEQPRPQQAQRKPEQPRPQQAQRPQEQAQAPQHARPDPQPQPQQRARPPQPPQRQVRPQQPQVQVQGRLPQQQQQQLIGQQQQRLVQYGSQLDQYQAQAPRQAADLQRQHRTAQYGFQQEYVAGLREQERGIQNARAYNYGSDPYFYTPPSYRYSRGGRSYETNEYGAGVLRQAINSGYQIGFGAGRADRQDRWAYNYRAAYGYQDGIYGYRGFYIDPADYRYYFRQGFRRGYEDGYYSRRRYGEYAGGRSTVSGSAFSVIITLRSIR